MQHRRNFDEIFKLQIQRDPKSALCVREGDRSTACLPDEGWFYTTKPEKGMSWNDLSQTDHIHQDEMWEAQKASVARAGPESKSESCQPQQYTRILTGEAKALTWINLVFPHLFQYIKPSK